MTVDLVLIKKNWDCMYRSCNLGCEIEHQILWSWLFRRYFSQKDNFVVEVSLAKITGYTVNEHNR